MPIVTKEWLKEFVETQPRAKIEIMVGRALVGLYHRQTEAERANEATKELNNRGFTAFDARFGSSLAKQYLRTHMLSNAQLEVWTKRNKKGFPKIARYARQLNEIAESKKEQK